MGGCVKKSTERIARYLPTTQEGIPQDGEMERNKDKDERWNCGSLAR